MVEETFRMSSLDGRGCCVWCVGGDTASLCKVSLLSDVCLSDRSSLD